MQKNNFHILRISTLAHQHISTSKKMLSKLKAGLYQRKLNQSKSERKRTAFNLENAQHIGLLFDATDDTQTQIVLNFKKDLQTQHKMVSLMAYKDVKLIDQAPDFPCFCNKDLGFNRTPNKPEVLEFIAKPFDLLICLYTHECLPLEYIAATSAAHFRIGHYQEDKTDFYDLMLYGKTQSLRAFIQQLEFYLQRVV